MSAPPGFTLQISSACLSQKLNVKLAGVEKVLLPLQQLEDFGNSPRLDSLYWNTMGWLNHTYVCLASCLVWGCLPALLGHRGVGRWKEKGSQGSKFKVEFNGAPWLVGLRHSLMLAWDNVVLCHSVSLFCVLTSWDLSLMGRGCNT